jgi:hypothetical protein
LSFALWEWRIPARVQLLTVLGLHAQPSSDLGVGEQAFCAESVGVAGQVVAAACVQHDAGGKRLALAGAVTGVVKRLGGLGVGVGVEEPVEGGEGVGVGLAALPSFRRDRDNVAGGLSAVEADVQVDAVGLVQGDVVDQKADHAFAVPADRRHRPVAEAGAVEEHLEAWVGNERGRGDDVIAGAPDHGNTGQHRIGRTDAGEQAARAGWGIRWR